MNKPINQPSWLPTRKLTGALLAAAAMEVLHPLIVKWLPILGGPAMGEVMTIGAGFLAGYLIKDLPNV